MFGEKDWHSLDQKKCILGSFPVSVFGNSRVRCIVYKQ